MDRTKPFLLRGFRVFVCFVSLVPPIILMRLKAQNATWITG
jgi:hypothetical protein